MKIKPASILFLFLIATLSFSCIDEGQTLDAIFEKDVKAIAEYVDASDMVNVKELIDPVTGISIIWQEVSGSKSVITRGDTIAADYTGRFLNDVVFDSSIDSVARANNIFRPQGIYVPIRFRTSSDVDGNRQPRVIPGFELGLLQLERGDKATIIIPSELAYGNDARQGIPQNSVLIFEVELFEVKTGPQQ
jgi:FKBP-type peptidyl-prolyl cis-trans isomerase FklB